MSLSHQVKNLERGLLKKIGSLFKKVFAAVKKVAISIVHAGKHKFTIMLVPHTERKPLNFQINTFLLIFILFLIVGVTGSFFFLTTQVSSNVSVINQQKEYMKAGEANLDTLRDEVVELQKIARVFQSTLSKSMESIGFPLPDKENDQLGVGDLASFSNVAKTKEGEIYEIEEIRKFSEYLKTTIPALNEMSDVFGNQKELLREIPTLWPLKGVKGRITQNFGPAENPFTKQWYLHEGIDIAYGYGVPIVSTADGKVVSIEYQPMGYGNYVVVRHKYGFYTRYGHLQKTTVYRGQDVDQGQVIGFMGSTGMSTGPHVHYEVMIGSELVDPARYLSITTDTSNRTVRW